MSNDRNFIIGNVFTKFKNAFEGLDYYTNLKQVENANTLTLTAYLTTEEKTWLNIKDLIETEDEPKAILNLLDNIKLFDYVFDLLNIQNKDTYLYTVKQHWTANVVLNKRNDTSKIETGLSTYYYCIITDKNNVFFFSKCHIILPSPFFPTFDVCLKGFGGLDE